MLCRMSLSMKMLADIFRLYKLLVGSPSNVAPSTIVLAVKGLLILAVSIILSFLCGQDKVLGEQIIVLKL